MGVRNSRGFFLILVAAVVAALAVILVQFGVDAELSALYSGNFRDELIACQGVESVLEGVKIAIEENQWHRKGIVSLISDKMSKRITCNGWITDEEGKLPVNRLVLEGPDGIEILQRYWELRGCSLQSLNALIDWIDPDSKTAQGSSEIAFYGSLGELPPNRPLQSIYELPGIPFMEREYERLRRLKEPPLSEGLTVWGEGRVNLLTASQDVLLSLSDDLTPDLVNRIIEERALGHIQFMEDFKRVVHVPDKVFWAFRRWGTLTSTTFRTRIEATYRKVHVVLKAVLWRRGFEVKVLYFREELWPPV